ncbi:MAG: hypothetical protein GY883_14465 [Shimia sp.]|nr:hypothetical protein [Shimia sp.]
MIELYQYNFDHPAEDEMAQATSASEQQAATTQPSLSPSEVTELLDVARREAYAEGYDAGTRDAAKDAEDDAAQQAAEVAEKLTAELQKLDAQGSARAQQAHMEVLELVLAVLSRTDATALQAQGEDALNAQLTKALHCAAHTPGVVLTVSPDLASRLSQDLPLWRRQVRDGFEINIVADDEAAAGTLRADWNGGGLTYDPSAALTALRDVLEAAADSGRREITTEN